MLPFVTLPEPSLLPLPDYVWFSVQASALVVLIFALERMYRLRKSYRFRKELRRMFMLLGAAFTIIILYFFIVGISFFFRFILGVAFALSIFFMVLHCFLLRSVQHLFWKYGIGMRRILLNGNGNIFEDLFQIWGEVLCFVFVGWLGGGWC